MENMELILPFVLTTAWLYLAFASPDYQVDVLYDMKLKLNASNAQLLGWSPNLMSPCYWTDVKCSPDQNVVEIKLPSLGFSGILSPRIGELRNLEVLSLQDNNITGGIPPEFGSLSNLRTLDLSNNKLKGLIPNSLGNMTKLQYMDLSYNFFVGEVPESISYLSNLININLAFNNLSGEISPKLRHIAKYNFTGNTLICGGRNVVYCESSTINSSGSHKPEVRVIISSVAGLLVAGTLLLLWLVGKHLRHEGFEDAPGEDDHELALGQVKRFAWRELQIATENFREENFLGQGGFGKVYKGKLRDGTKIAVKRLFEHESTRGHSAFLQEVQFISVAVHRNILRLIGFCATSNERILVYPFMENLSVAHHLRELKEDEPVLDWATRRRVALGTACGLEYLHEHCNPKIIHRDVKAANIFLDENFEPVIGDFGLAKLLDRMTASATTEVQGTMGHIAPEYITTGRPSEKTDVFGYGVMLLELISGQRAIEVHRFKEDDILLLDLAKRLVEEGHVDKLVDHRLSGNYKIEDVERMVQIALLCTHISACERPSMSEVVQMLEAEVPADRWENWQLTEIIQRQYYDRMHTRYQWQGEPLSQTLSYVEPVELSAPR